VEWLIPGRVAPATDMAEVDDWAHTVWLLGRAARAPAYGRNSRGHFVVDRPLPRADRPGLHEIQSFVDFLRYEHAARRVVAIVAQPTLLAQVCVECLSVAEGWTMPQTQALTRHYAQALARDGEHGLRQRAGRLRGVLRRTLIHTTSAEAVPSIIRDGALKSSPLLRQGPAVGAIFFKEPEDYADYVMFKSFGGYRGGITGEIVVNSRRVGEFWHPDRAAGGDYVPGVRLYFSRPRLECHPRVAFDGVHNLKVRGQLELAGHLMAVSTADSDVAGAATVLGVPVLQARADTPEQFVAKSDQLFLEAMGDT
jgi:hypothetical protein